VKLDFGCGPRKKLGFVGVDICPFQGVDILYDGKRLPLEDNSVDEVYSSHVFEHVPDLFATVADLYRVSKDGAKWTIAVPHFSSPWFCYTWDHLRPFGALSFKNADVRLRDSCEQFLWGKVNLRTERVKFHWWADLNYLRDYHLQDKPAWKRALLRSISPLLSTLANAAPFLCDRIWCRWVGGFGEVVFTLRVVK